LHEQNDQKPDHVRRPARNREIGEEANRRHDDNAGNRDCTERERKDEHSGEYGIAVDGDGAQPMDA
jgi:hypothetical protein